MSDKNKLFDKKRVGDNVTVANMMGTTPNNIAQIMRRPNAKRHQEAINALAKVIETRDKLISK